MSDSSTIPQFSWSLLGWTRTGTPNIADGSSQASVAIAEALFRSLGIQRTSTEAGQTLGRRLEETVAEELRSGLPLRNDSRTWHVHRNQDVTEFTQYMHLARIDELVRQLPVLRAEFGSDYVVRPDVTVGLDSGGSALMLHASVSCKFTIRSDRVQNIRHEGVVLTRHRRGRQPHIAVVTAEPLPSRLASIARGTGEVDRVYHIALEELVTAVTQAAPRSQNESLEELRTQDRLADFETFLRQIALG